MKKSTLVGCLIAFISPIWIMYLFAFIARFDVFAHKQPWAVANVVASMMIWIFCVYIAVLAHTFLTEEYKSWKKCNSARRDKMLDLIKAR